MNWTEILGFVSGAVCVWLAVRQNIWNFPVGMANNVFFFILFIGSGLYADAWLQVLYLILGGLGWYWWLRGGQDRSHLVVRRTPAWAWPAIGVAVAGGTWAIWALLSVHTDSTVPWGDATTTALSLGAQVMLNRKWIGNWLLWICADAIYIGLYAYKGLYLTAGLYGLFLAMCFVGLAQWRATLREESATARTEREKVAA
ncbi:nicotinamide riboside transporter PnuC [Acidipropionibacterium jensenii]|uniref:Nicotinamide riboside transporter PnuC n=1 Tax=Acidipropionibacterium jensenii TaxID=1749 RepID=A0A3T0RY91_9ACTN|nr:nicotinamide riboside transporter PnuC [Acidipropionibacterium jensenii]AZZ39067.1 nicotinamide riboside transporter PnuC [Acidipropionibacterium jensenii]